jgi:hypothetical protein
MGSIALNLSDIYCFSNFEAQNEHKTRKISMSIENYLVINIYSLTNFNWQDSRRGVRGEQAEQSQTG